MVSAISGIYVDKTSTISSTEWYQGLPEFLLIWVKGSRIVLKKSILYDYSKLMPTMVWLTREPAHHPGGFFLKKISS